MPSLGPAGRGGARRRSRRRMSSRQAASAAQQPAPAPTPAETASNPMEKLKKLGELHKAGVLTDDEFSAKKADILAKM